MIISSQAIRKLKSVKWRLNNLYKIKDKDGNLVKFKMNKMQEDFVYARKGHKRNLVIKYRQGGFTTFRCIELLDKAMWIPGTTCAILAHEKEAVTKIFRIVKRAFDNIPAPLRPKIKYNNKNELEFIEDFTGRKLDSVIYVALKLRATTTKHLHISESAHIEGEARQELNAGSKETVPKDGDITEETTANGYNEFYEEVQQALDSYDAKDGIPKAYKKRVYFFSWLDNPEYSFPGLTEADVLPLDEEEIRLGKLGATAGNIAWRRWKLKDLGGANTTEKLLLTPVQLFKQEYPATLEEAFQASGNTFFDIDKVLAIQPKEPIRMWGDFKIWEEPSEDKSYCIGVDPSNGKGVDNAAISVWDQDYNKVAEFYGYCDPDVLGDRAIEIGTFYNEAFIVVENNLLTTVLAIRDNYPTSKMYMHVRVNKQTKERTKELGFPTTTRTRDLLTRKYQKYFREDGLYNPSRVSKAEMTTFIITESGKPEHAPSKHDDMIFADMLAVYGIDFMPASVSVGWL